MKIINPITNRPIQYGGKTHKKLIQQYGGKKLSYQERLSKQKRYQEGFFNAAIRGDLELVKELITHPDVDPAAQNNQAIIAASTYGHLPVVEFLVSLPNVNPAAHDNLAIISASNRGHLPVVEFLANLPEVDPAARNNRAIIGASTHGHLPVVEFLASLPAVSPTARKNRALHEAIVGRHLPVVKFLASLSEEAKNNKALRLMAINGGERYIPVVKFLLAIGAYDSSKPLSNLTINNSEIKRLLAAVDLIPNSAFSKKEIDTVKKEIETEQRRLLMADVLKICTTLRDVSAYEQVEILDNLSKYAVNIPYNVKWNMITKCKHFTPNPQSTVGNKPYIQRK